MDQMKIAHTHTLYLRCTSKKPFTDEAWNENKKRWKMETMDDGGYIQYWIKSYCCWLPLLPRLHIFHVCIPAKLINSKLIPTLHVEFLLFFSTLAAAYWVVRLTCIHFSLSSFDIWCDLWLIVANFLLFFCLAIFVCSAIQVPELKLFARPILKIVQDICFGRYVYMVFAMGAKARSSYNHLSIWYALQFCRRFYIRLGIDVYKHCMSIWFELTFHTSLFQYYY